MRPDRSIDKYAPSLLHLALAPLLTSAIAGREEREKERGEREKERETKTLSLDECGGGDALSQKTNKEGERRRPRNCVSLSLSM